MNDSPENGSTLETTPEKMGSSVKGIFYGTLIDIGGSLIFSTLLGMVYGVILIKQGVPPDQLVEKMQTIDPWSILGLFGVSVGTLLSGLGGYVCASKSIANVTRDSAILSAISVSFGLAIGMNSYSLIGNLFFAALTVAAIFAGAQLWKIKKIKTDFEKLGHSKISF